MSEPTSAPPKLTMPNPIPEKNWTSDYLTFLDEYWEIFGPIPGPVKIEGNDFRL